MSHKGKRNEPSALYKKDKYMNFDTIVTISSERNRLQAQFITKVTSQLTKFSLTEFVSKLIIFSLTWAQVSNVGIRLMKVLKFFLFWGRIPQKAGIFLIDLTITG